jgi:hypothetical protein
MQPMQKTTQLISRVGQKKRISIYKLSKEDAMFYLVEKLNLQVATPKNLDRFIEIESHQILPVYERCNAKLMASWICSAKTLMQITNAFELESLDSTLKIYDAINDNSSYEDVVQLSHSLISQTDWQLFRSCGQKFSEAFHQAIQASQSTPVRSYTVATLELNRNKMPLLLPKQEGAIDIGMPLIAFMKSVTGKHDQIIDIWKGDLQAAGYQTQAYYESIGMSEEWWDWIRDIAPKEKMVKVSVLPYSPLK